MYQPISFFIGFRYYTRRNDKNKFSRFIFHLPTIGITISVMVLIIVLSIMNGFERELQDHILKFIPHAIISSTNGSLNQNVVIKLTNLKGICNITPLTISDVILQSSNNISIGIMLGIDPNYQDSLTPYLIHIKQNMLRSGKYNVILGNQLARQLGVHCGDQLRIIIPSISQFTVIGRLPSQRIFNIIGIFSTNSEVDSYQLLVNIQDASHLMNYPVGNITGWRLWLNEPLKIDKINYHIIQNKGKTWEDWRKRKGDLFQAIKIEKNTIGILLSLIIIISSLNILIPLGLTVLEKQREVAILQSQGMTLLNVMLIFITQGVISGTIGAILGSLLGIFFSNYLNNFLLINNFLLDDLSLKIPVSIEVLQVIKISLVTIIVSMFISFYFSYRSSIIKLSEALRYE